MKCGMMDALTATLIAARNKHRANAIFSELRANPHGPRRYPSNRPYRLYQQYRFPFSADLPEEQKLLADIFRVINRTLTIANTPVFSRAKARGGG